MTPLYSIWLVSLVGATLFFVSGFFLARRHLGEAAAVDGIVPPRAPPPVVDASSPTAAAFPAEPAATIQILREEVDELRTALRRGRARDADRVEIERELVRLRADRTELEEKAHELAASLTSAQARLAELEQALSESAAPKGELATAATERQAHAEFDDQPRDASADGVAAPPPRLPRLGTGPLRLVAERRSIGEQLTCLLLRLRGKHMRSIALADEAGLPIVGLGDDAGALAAFAGYVAVIGRKLPDFLPMGSLRRVMVEDENEATVTACPLPAGDSRIALVTLTAGPGPSARQMADVLRSAAGMIR